MAMAKPHEVRNSLRESSVKLATVLSAQEKQGLFATVSQKTLQPPALARSLDNAARGNELLGMLL